MRNEDKFEHNIVNDPDVGPFLNKDVRVSVPLSPKELAALWWDMDSNQQAEFFNYIGELETEDILCRQLSMVQASKKLSSESRDVMNKIGLFA